MTKFKVVYDLDVLEDGMLINHPFTCHYGFLVDAVWHTNVILQACTRGKAIFYKGDTELETVYKNY